MTKYRLDPQVERFMKTNDCDELEAANALQLNFDEIYDVVEGGQDYTFDDND